MLKVEPERLPLRAPVARACRQVVTKDCACRYDTSSAVRVEAQRFVSRIQTVFSMGAGRGDDPKKSGACLTGTLL